jgi:hydrogenase expression/formation protein HypE
LGAVMSRDLVPLMDETRAIADFYTIDPLGMLSSGTLLATVTAGKLDHVVACAEDADIELAVIGKVTSPKSGFQLLENNYSRELPSFQTDEVTRALATTP